MLKIKSSLKIFKLNLRQTINCILEDNNENQSIIKFSIITTNLGSMLTCRIRLNVLQKKNVTNQDTASGSWKTFCKIFVLQKFRMLYINIILA